MKGGYGGNPPRLGEAQLTWQRTMVTSLVVEGEERSSSIQTRPTNKRNLFLEVCGSVCTYNMFKFTHIGCTLVTAMALLVGGEPEGGNPPPSLVVVQFWQEMWVMWRRMSHITHFDGQIWVISGDILQLFKIVDNYGLLGRKYWNIYKENITK